MEVLVDGRERGRWKGRTRTDKLVFLQESAIPTPGPGAAEEGMGPPLRGVEAADYQGQMVQVRIDKTSPWSLQGVPMPSWAEGEAQHGDRR